VGRGITTSTRECFNVQHAQREEPGIGVYDLVLKRRSIRKYGQEPIRKEPLDKLLDALRLAPSGGNGDDAAMTRVPFDVCSEGLPAILC